MTYSGRTPFYGIPYLKEGDKLDEVGERRRTELLENLIRGAVLAEGDTRVFKEGSFTTRVSPDDSVTVRLVGSPAVRGLCRAGLVEVNGSLEWKDLRAGSVYYLYIQSTRETYQNPSLVKPVWDRAPKLLSDHLLLAVLDNRVKGEPVLDTSPPGKAIGSNLFSLLNDPTDPFGSELIQTNLRVTRSLTVSLAKSSSLLVRQISRDAAQPLLIFDNASAKPEISSSRELRLADPRITLPLSDPDNRTLASGSTSIVGALNAAFQKAPPPIIQLSRSQDDPKLVMNVIQGRSFTVTLDNDCYLSSPIGTVEDGAAVRIRVSQDQIGGHHLEFHPDFQFNPTQFPQITQEPNKTDYLEILYNAPLKKWDVVSFSQGY